MVVEGGKLITGGGAGELGAETIFMSLVTGKLYGDCC